MLGCDTCPLFWNEQLDNGSERLYCADEAIDRMRVDCPDWQDGEWGEEIERGKDWQAELKAKIRAKLKGSDT